MGQGLIWAAYKGHLLEQGLKNRIRELELQAVHMRSLWKSKWGRTKHQLIQRLQTHLISLHVLALAVRDRLHVGRQQLCLRLGDASSQILSWMGNLYGKWWYTISKELSRSRVYSPNLWQFPKATSFTEDGVDEVAVLDRRTATRRFCRVSGSSRLVLLFLCGLKAYAPTLWQYPMASSPTEDVVDDVAAMDRRTAMRTTCSMSGLSRLALLFLCGLKLLHEAQRLRDPGQAVLRLQVDQQRTSAAGSIVMEPSWQKWCYQNEEMEFGRVKYPETSCQEETLMAEIWNGRMFRIPVKGIVGRAMRKCGVESVYGYAHPIRKVRECYRIYRLPSTSVVFKGPIDKG